MRRRGRGKLTGPLSNRTLVGHLLKERMLPQPRLDMLPAKGIGQQHDRRVVLAQKGRGDAGQAGWGRLIGQARLDQSGQVGKTAVTIVGSQIIVHDFMPLPAPSVVPLEPKHPDNQASYARFRGQNQHRSAKPAYVLPHQAELG